MLSQHDLESAYRVHEQPSPESLKLGHPLVALVLLSQMLHLVLPLAIRLALQERWSQSTAQCYSRVVNARPQVPKNELSICQPTRVTLCPRGGCVMPPYLATRVLSRRDSSPALKRLLQAVFGVSRRATAPQISAAPALEQERGRHSGSCDAKDQAG